MGVVLVIFLPIAFLLASAWFIWRRLYHSSIPQRRAAFILQEDPEVIQVEQSSFTLYLCQAALPLTLLAT